ncbi:leucyl/phenylalanyl-tRNA--protein transferase [uncultured Jannaschia sp.]|uniref:leucyl/phenylalanyl-tRNA--protein transferase n=1 Tax=uncultured Jannaschia sp. TaxID=293347 RepID=UPI0026045E3D|nr:leucyl/phenylalanyl-tRNA--protein transferase [uncultured Jannaschia sp.]
MPRDTPEITPETLLMAYAAGIFPMAEAQDDPEIYWVDPKRRGVFPLDGFRLSRSLAKVIRRGDYEVTLDRDFAGVVDACAARETTWINAPIRRLYAELYADDYAHSLEVWSGGALVGGVYGVTLGTAFFGESMFSRRRDMSKLALAFLVTLLRQRGYTLFDTQFLTDHLASLGAVEIPRQHYHTLLADALQHRARLTGPVPQPSEVAHLRSQTS